MTREVIRSARMLIDVSIKIYRAFVARLEEQNARSRVEEAADPAEPAS